LIEVLRKSDVLQIQRTGEEMLRKTGKLCLDRTTAVFHRHLSQSQSGVPANQDEVVPYSGKLGAEICMQSSLKVSRSIPHSCSNPVLAAYKKYLQCYYSARTLAPADKYLPIMEAPYINLAIIGKGRYDPSQRDQFTKSTLHGGVDQILQNKKPINFENLLTYYEGRKPVRFVLVDGPPGIGKSTFAWEVCRRWDENFLEYNIVVLLKLREKWVLNATSLSDLFRYPPDPDYSKCIAKIRIGRDVLPGLRWV
jgi:hypothetical protein